MPAIQPFLDVPDLIVETGGEGLDLCFACGTCTGLCPWGYVRDFNVRLLIRSTQLGLEPDDTADVWRCATCAMCVANCPREVPIIDVMRAMRKMTGEGGSQPATLRAMLASQGQNGNPWAGEAEERNDWARDLDIPDKAVDGGWMLYACCTQCYAPEVRPSAVALTRLMQLAGLPLWISPTESVCCGCSVRETGADELWRRMGKDNLTRFEKAGTLRILCASPHCYNAFIKDYKDWGGDYQVRHAASMLKTLLDEGRLELKNPVARKVTYHDPCYLGRHNDIYEDPRECIRALPGVDFVEMPRNREDALCCGGGGAQIFMDAPVDERFANLRVQEALETGADTLITACPYCNSMFRDSIKSLDAEDRMEVLDIAELLWLSAKPEGS